MAGQSANVTSVDALRGFRAALVKFAAEVESALIALDLEARRPVEWIESNRARYWPLQVRKASDEVSEARLALDRCQVKISSEDEKSCYDERKMLEKAKRRLQLAEEKTDAVKRWRYQMHKATEDFQVQTARAKQYLETELVKAVAALDRMTAALDRYAEQAVNARGGERGRGGRGRSRMRICNLTDGLGQMRHAFSTLNERWAETKEHWSDETRREFEESYLQPLPGQLQMLMTAVQGLAAIVEKAAKELDDKSEQN